MTTPTVLWFRRDLRLADHAALLAAVDGGPGSRWRRTCWVSSSRTTRLLRPSGAPRRAFLAGCLTRLSESMGDKLLIVKGSPDAVIPRIAAAVGRTRPCTSRPTSCRTAAAVTSSSRKPCATRTSSWSRPVRRTRWRPGGCASRTAAGTRCSPRTSAAGPSTAGARPPSPADDVSWVDPADLVDAAGGRRLRPEDLGIAVPDGLDAPRPRRTGRGGALEAVPCRRRRAVRRRT